MDLCRTCKVTIWKNRCPPESWVWLKRMVGVTDDRPHIFLMADSYLVEELNRRAKAEKNTAQDKR